MTCAWQCDINNVVMWWCHEIWHKYLLCYLRDRTYDTSCIYHHLPLCSKIKDEYSAKIQNANLSSSNSKYTPTNTTQNIIAQSLLTCSYRSMSVLSGNFRDCIACSTVSQWPLLISATKLSMLSTVFRDTVVSSCNVARARWRLFSFRYCMIKRMTLKKTINTINYWYLLHFVSPSLPHK